GVSEVRTGSGSDRVDREQALVTTTRSLPLPVLTRHVERGSGSVFDLLHRDCNRRFFSGGPTIRDPVPGLWIADHFVRRTICPLVRVSADNVLRTRNIGGTIHEIDRDCRDGLGLVIVNLHRLILIEEINIHLIRLVAGTAKLLSRL